MSSMKKCLTVANGAYYFSVKHQFIGVRMSKKKSRGDKSDLSAENKKEKPENGIIDTAAGEDTETEKPSPDVESAENEQLFVKCEEENLDLRNQLLRKQADFENFRKRMNRDKEDAIRYANQMLLLDILPVLDDFERAVKSSEESEDFNGFHSGVVMIEKQFASMLESKWGLKRYESTGEVFNPDNHQAIAAEESDEYDKPTVIEDYQSGYFFHERVLRPAKVKVAQPKNASDPAAGEEEPSENQGE